MSFSRRLVARRHHADRDVLVRRTLGPYEQPYEVLLGYPSAPPRRARETEDGGFVAAPAARDPDPDAR